MIECIGRHLPLYKIQLIGETTKFRILYRNLLFPLAMRNESYGKQQIMEEKEPKLTDTEEDPSIEHVNNFKGPINRSKMKKMENVLLLKANALM